MKNLAKHIEQGKVYRRSDLEYFSTSIDRELAELTASGQQAPNKITLNAVHNTFDLINDKIMKGITLVQEEEILKANFLVPLEKKYDALIATYINEHLQVSSLTEEEIHLV